MVSFLFTDTIAIDPAAAVKALGSAGAREALAASADTLAALDGFRTASIEEALRSLAERLGIKPKVVFQAIRVAVTGSTVSPPLFETLELLGRGRAIERIRAAVSRAVDDPATHP
jgi:glutamyl-tRNA synthetase